MKRALKVCSHPGCAKYAPCPVHTPKPWASSQRPTRVTLSGWAQQRRATRILQRDSTVCHICGRPGATEVDHVVPLQEGGADTDDNLAAIHARPCHAEKSLSEAQAGRQRRDGDQAV